MQSAPAPPAAPNAKKAAQAQFGTNLGTAAGQAAIGNANVQGPAGSTSYNVTGQQTITGPGGETYQVPTYTQTNTLSPENQAIYSGLQGAQQNQLGTLNSALSQPYGAEFLPSVENDFSADRARVEAAMFDRLNPQLERDRLELEDRLVNQGFQRGTEAFTNAMGEYGRNVNDARLGITARGLQEQQGLFGMAQSNRQRALGEMTTLRNQPINEMNALTGGANMMLPNYGGYNAPTLGQTDQMGAMYNSAALQQAQWQQQQQSADAYNAGLFGLGQATLGAGGRVVGAYMSDRRLKHSIRDLGIKLLNGVKLYAYRYLWDDKPMVGVMADELAHVRPDAVTMHNGYLAVDYELATR